MTALTQAHLEVPTVNSHHQGAEFGVIVLEDSDTQFSLGECLALLEKDGWSTRQEVPSTRAGVHTYLIARKK